MKVSIAIPAYTDATEEGFRNLSVLLDSIKNQDYTDIEIVVSDHSEGVSLIEDLCDKVSEDLNIIYTKYDRDKGYWGANVNNAMKRCSGELIKFMQQDDYFSNKFSISKIVETYLDKEFEWAICGGVHTRDYKTFYHQVIPRWTQDIYKGNNKLGGVSSIIIKNNKNKLYFEKSLNWMGDCDYYKRLQKSYGYPVIIEESLIVYKQWSGQFTNTIPSEIKIKETNILIEKYGN